MFNDDDYKKMRKAIAMGITDAVVGVAATVLIAMAIMWIITTIIVNPLRLSFDPTDNDQTGERSNLALRVDHGTGCEYLESTEGYLTPRLDKDGKQVCGK